jgi:hypothetical protein
LTPRAWFTRAAALTAIAAALVGGLARCNAVLGIERASLLDAGAETAPGAPNTYAVNCTNYCTLMAANCKATSQGDDTEYQVSDAGICEIMCNVRDNLGDTMISADTVQPHADSLSCRVWHANAAASGSHVHCPHAGPLGGMKCDDDNYDDGCIPFCTLDLSICTGQAAAYASYGDCLNACRKDGGYPGFQYRVDSLDPEVSDLATQFQNTGNTLNCRLYHLQNYLRTHLAVHCTHTAQSGGGVCVDNDN